MICAEDKPVLVLESSVPEHAVQKLRTLVQFEPVFGAGSMRIAKSRSRSDPLAAMLAGLLRAQ